MYLDKEHYVYILTATVVIHLINVSAKQKMTEPFAFMYF